MWFPNVPKTARADHPTSAVRRVDVRQVAEDTVGYVGADLVLLVRETHQRAMAEDPDQVADRRLEEARGFRVSRRVFNSGLDIDKFYPIFFSRDSRI